MLPLDKALRGKLEDTVRKARYIAEGAARAALEQLGVGEANPYSHLSDPERDLRRRLRSHGRSLGDARRADGRQDCQRLVWEIAYEHWHRMLFARFLADNNLLMYDGVAVTLEECEELAEDEDAKSGWELAGRLAARMLPQVFKPKSPAFELTFAPEDQAKLTKLLADLSDDVFKASDSLGWVYQFWQAQRKEDINKSEVKIGADELPAVTQLFTEPYMVEFLLHNSLGAWWVTRYPKTPCPVELTYLRTLEDGAPVAGKFEGWPDRLADFKLLDPSCGSGHFLVAAFLMLVPMRMAAEGSSAKQAVDAVLRDNLYGLEIDARCVEIAVFALALAAWRFADERGKPLGVRPEMPSPNIACCGLQVAARAQDWEALVPDNAANAALLRQELRLLHASFARAPLLGSLLDPARNLKNDLATAGIDTLKGLLDKALASEATSTQEEKDSAWDLALSAQGLLEAARILDMRYHLVITNVPYKKLNELCDDLRDFCERNYPKIKGDLANVFLERCIELAQPGGAGVVQIVMPQNWLFLTTYKKQREQLLNSTSWNLLARIDEHGFDSPQAAGAFTILLTITNAPATTQTVLQGIDASPLPTPQEKARWLKTGEFISVNQRGLLRNPDAIVSLGDFTGEALFAQYAGCFQGTSTGDNFRFVRSFWEFGGSDTPPFFQGPSDETKAYGGRESVVLWNEMEEFEGAAIRGDSAWGRRGVAIGQMRSLPATLYSGHLFSNSTPVIVPKKAEDLPAIWCFCTSDEFFDGLRAINPKLSVDNGYVSKIEVDFARWREVASERYPGGLPKPYSNDPTQWVFHGHPQPSTDPLQVAVARLLGYTWPAELDNKMELSDEARTWIARAKQLAAHADTDGIVCLPALGGEKPAHERLSALLADAWNTVEPGSWKTLVVDKLLADADHAGKSLETWLRDKFFVQHCKPKLFGNRPFIWHIWDGMPDGFAALVNYHKLDYKTLEALIYTYLGDWISRQKQDIANGVDGAQEKLAAAEALKKRLELILEGEAPYDIFVRWKSIEQQPIGWNPDLNDGVRLNIRPFLSVSDVGKRGTGVLRDKPNSLHWEKDRGKDVVSAPWYHLFDGDRINDHHLSLEEKQKARSGK